ncbi:unnamed protein product [Bursaphelenchus xylophilus]|uniref:(pine wood nematode) hypothetical protein n=1 Tax=Bursaphelenchus xylophilus TaxID=6326 RepID=A0A1I7RL87_BURXY|nr:unnamed protein product [Bursaphelenchus xylophilus]CAG9083307.1 unnamed protein product [Bursaphelenchus xylophilus]
MTVLSRTMVLFLIILLTFPFNVWPKIEKCLDKDMNCYTWVAESPERCQIDELIMKDCKKACGNCSETYEVEEKYDIKNLAPSLHKIAFLVGIWRSEFGGKADFPTIPRFTYGEQLDISIAKSTRTPVLNYTAFAWDNGDLTELHSENGYITGHPNNSIVAMTTVMSNGFATVEQGNETDHSVRFRLRNIGRINFSRDLPVRRMVRDWILLNETHMEARLLMATSTHPMLLHTQIIYKKLYP